MKISRSSRLRCRSLPSHRWQWWTRTSSAKGTRALAEAYLNYLYSEEGQRIAAKNFYRPRNEAVAADQDQFPALKLVTIDRDFGGWGRTTEVLQ